MMPDFLIIGAAKCGTTALYHYLNQHPRVYTTLIRESGSSVPEGERLELLESQCLIRESLSGWAGRD